jgi:hypothetical protein
MTLEDDMHAWNGKTGMGNYEVGKTREERKSVIDSSFRKTEMICTGGLMVRWF